MAKLAHESFNTRIDLLVVGGGLFEALENDDDVVVYYPSQNLNVKGADYVAHHLRPIVDVLI
jgi:hypothetical protein